MSFNGSIIAVGGYGDDSEAGALWLFHFNEASGLYWQQVPKLIGLGATGKASIGKAWQEVMVPRNQ